jgi:phosphoserine phosphatase RsbU/P
MDEAEKTPIFPALHHVPDAVLVVDLENRIRYANPAVATLLGWSTEELDGRILLDLIPPRLRAAHESGFRRFATGAPMRWAGTPLRVAALHRNGQEIDIDLVLGSVPGENGERWAMGVLRDVGDRLALEREILVGRYLRASIDVAAALQKASDTPTAFDALLPALCEHLDWDLAAIWQPNAANGRLTCVARWHDGTLAATAAAMTEGISIRLGEGLPGQVWTSQRPTLLSATAGSEAFPRAAIAVRHGLTTGLGFPLLGSAGPLGVVEFWSGQARAADDDLQAVLLSIGRQLGVFIERVEAEAELRQALAVLQTSLLPAALPAVPHLRLGAHYQPGGRVGVGGDFFDVFALRDGRWAAVIADVCGKGAGAAAVTAMARYTIRAAALEHADPTDVLAILNQALLGDTTTRPFLTACLVFLDTRSGGASATVTVAGHPLPLLRKADGVVRPVGECGDLLGVMDTPVFHPRTVQLQPGDVLLLYTDGFTEARDVDNVQLGETGLAELFATLRQHEPADLVKALAAGLARHADSHQTNDDAAALAIGAVAG